MAALQTRKYLEELVDTDKDRQPRHFGTRYNEAGQFVTERGNTVVCHVREGSVSQKALLDVRNRLMQSRYAGHFAFTAPSSLHMTLSEGVIETRRAENFWPASMDLNASVDAVTRAYMPRMRDVADCGTFEMKIDAVTPNGLAVSGATQKDAATLTAWRDALIGAFGYRQPNHDAYGFHITMAYIIKWLPEAAVDDYVVLLEDCLSHLRETITTLELDKPAFCTFEDMNHFEPRLHLA